jgi:hypothetical protein
MSTFDVSVRPRDSFKEENSSFWTSNKECDLWFDVIIHEKVHFNEPNTSTSLKAMKNERSFLCFMNLEKHLHTKKEKVCPRLGKLAHRYSKHKKLLKISPEVYIASQLQTYLEDLLEDKDVSNSTILQHFLLEQAPYSALIPSYERKLKQALCEEELIHEKIPSGCTHEV